MSAFSPKQSQRLQRTPSNATSHNAPMRSTSHHEHPILKLQRKIGNQAVLRALQVDSKSGELASTNAGSLQHSFDDTPVFSPSIRGMQRKLTVNTPGDAYEQEADRVAEQVMRMPAPQAESMPEVSGRTAGVQRTCACGGSCDNCKNKNHDEKNVKVQMKAAGPGNAGGAEAPPIVHDVLRSSGQPLDRTTRNFMEPRFGQDFSSVRVHTDAKAAESAKAVGARAYTVGQNVIFGKGEFTPGTNAGQTLLGHELTHVVQQRPHAAHEVVHRQIKPESVSGELVGQQFSLRKDFSAHGKMLAAGTAVTVVSWINTADTVEVRHSSVAGTFNVPKVLLLPKQASVPGIAPYGTGLEKLEQTTEKHGAKLEEFRKTAPKDRMKDFAKDLTEREADQAKMANSVNTRLIQGAMLNRFDASIKKWVDFYNARSGFKDALDPNLVKAIIYRESSMGTNEPFMNDPPTHPIQIRFNLLQAVDSPINDIVPIMREMAPSLFAKYHIEDIETKLMAVEVEFDKLKGKARDASDDARFAELSHLEDHGNWKPWFFSQPGFNDAVVEFLGTVDAGKKHSEDYDFWIHAGIRALFAKREEIKAKSWEETVRHYNPAKEYFKFVERQRSGALAAQKKKQEFIPENL